jgi:hypothetical protein
MKKFILFFAVMFCFSFLKAQTYGKLDVSKLNKALKERKVSGYTFDSITEYYGLLGTYKDTNGDELIISFDPPSRFQEISKEKKKGTKITKFKKGKTNLIYFENEFINVIYIDLPDLQVTMSLTSAFKGREVLEKLYTELNPEELFKEVISK